MSRGVLSVVLLLSVGALAGCLADDPAPDAAPDARVAPHDWITGLSEPVFDGLETSVHYIEAEDGTQLSLTLHLPVGFDQDAGIPTLLQLTPYQSFVSLPHVDPELPPPSSSWRFFVERGAAYVEADARGTNGSEGCLDFGGSADRADARVFLDWILDRAWSNGVVVTDGVSHPGMGSVVAHAADPRLSGALAHAPVVSYYQDQWYGGAKFDTQLNGVAYQAVESSPGKFITHPESLQAQPASCTGKTTTDYEHLDGPFTSLWDDRHLARHSTPSDTPILITHGFIDTNVHPEHAQFYWDALPEDADKNLIMGYWYHGWPDMDGHDADAREGVVEVEDAASFQHIRHRWIDELLFQRETGLDPEPRVLVEDSQGTWHESDDWPLDGSERVVLHADASNGSLSSTTPPAAGSASYKDRVDAVRGTWTDAHTLFRSEPLEARTLVNGAPQVHLVASSDQTETKWVVYLLDEAPDGTWQRISHGYADSHMWGAEDEWLPIEPETAYAWDIPLMPTAVVVEPGHRIVLLVASSDNQVTERPGAEVPCFDDYRGGCYNPSGIVPAATSGSATNTVWTGAEGTSVTWDQLLLDVS